MNSANPHELQKEIRDIEFAMEFLEKYFATTLVTPAQYRLLLETFKPFGHIWNYDIGNTCAVFDYENHFKKRLEQKQDKNKNLS